MEEFYGSGLSISNLICDFENLFYSEFGENLLSSSTSHALVNKLVFMNTYDKDVGYINNVVKVPVVLTYYIYEYQSLSGIKKDHVIILIPLNKHPY
jgi:hypothetical protein